jgi:hypothetical protein
MRYNNRMMDARRRMGVSEGEVIILITVMRVEQVRRRVATGH